MPRVSVVLTSFNHEKYICEAIDCVLNQTFSDFELIIWDDASSDNTWHLIKQYSDSRIKSFRNEEQKRGIWGINKAISEVAMGEYIAIHHSDDTWEQDKLEKQVEFLEVNTDVGAVFTNAHAINEDSLPLEDDAHIYSSIFSQENRSRYEWLNHFFLKGNALCHPSVLIRKKCYEDCGLYRYGFAQLGDFDMWVRLCLKYDIYVMPEKLIRFRVRANEANASGNTLDARTRIFTEYYFIIANYMQLTNFDEFIQVFPESVKYVQTDEPILNYMLARVIIDRDGFALSKLFALEILFGLINDPHMSERLYEAHGFSAVDFVNLTRQIGIANKSVKEAEDGDMRIVELSGELECLRGELQGISQERDEIVNSFYWKASFPLRLVAQQVKKLMKKCNLNG